MPSNSVAKIQFLSGSPDTFLHVAVGTVSTISMAPALDDDSTAGPTAHSPPTLSSASITTCLNPSTQHKVAQQGEQN